MNFQNFLSTLKEKIESGCKTINCYQLDNFYTKRDIKIFLSEIFRTFKENLPEIFKDEEKEPDFDFFLEILKQYFDNCFETKEIKTRFLIIFFIALQGINQNIPPSYREELLATCLALCENTRNYNETQMEYFFNYFIENNEQNPYISLFQCPSFFYFQGDYTKSLFYLCLGIKNEIEELRLSKTLGNERNVEVDGFFTCDIYQRAFEWGNMINGKTSNIPKIAFVFKNLNLDNLTDFEKIKAFYYLGRSGIVKSSIESIESGNSVSAMANEAKEWVKQHLDEIKSEQEIEDLYIPLKAGFQYSISLDSKKSKIFNDLLKLYFKKTENENASLKRKNCENALFQTLVLGLRLNHYTIYPNLRIFNIIKSNFVFSENFLPDNFMFCFACCQSEKFCKLWLELQIIGKNLSEDEIKTTNEYSEIIEYTKKVLFFLKETSLIEYWDIGCSTFDIDDGRPDFDTKVKEYCANHTEEMNKGNNSSNSSLQPEILKTKDEESNISPEVIKEKSPKSEDEETLNIAVKLKDEELNVPQQKNENEEQLRSSKSEEEPTEKFEEMLELPKREDEELLKTKISKETLETNEMEKLFSFLLGKDEISVYEEKILKLEYERIDLGIEFDQEDLDKVYNVCSNILQDVKEEKQNEKRIQELIEIFEKKCYKRSRLYIFALKIYLFFKNFFEKLLKCKKSAKIRLKSSRKLSNNSFDTLSKKYAENKPATL
ncbi:MAG: hypothetical protein LBJ09_01720 [Clostridiales bacterium]|jgi:hypothetical protein|nr:hypothetical protein [Clostridiales bacterium]